jgi:hypothetical protein
MGFWDDFQTVFKKGVTVVAQKTDEYTKIGRIKVDIIALKRDMDKRTNELGNRVYQMLAVDGNSKISTDDTIKAMVQIISDLRQKLDEKSVELEAVRKEYGAPTDGSMDNPVTNETEPEVKG